MDQPNAEMFYKREGCDTRDPIACLRAKTPEQLQLPRDVTDPLQFLPSVDGNFVPESVDKILLYKSSISKSIAAREFFQSLDLLTRVNNYDGVLYVIGVWPSLVGYKDINNPRITRDQLENIVFEDIIKYLLKPLDDQARHIIKHLLTNEYINWKDPDSFTSTRMSLANISNDAEFFFPATCITEAHAESTKSRTYFYEFVYTPLQHALPTPTWINGANHGDEVSMVLGKPLSNITVSTEDDKYVSRAITTMWANFAKSGNPNTPQDVTRYIHTMWPEYNLIRKQYFEISSSMADTSIKQYFQQQRMMFWSEISQ
ncbi:postsynaptic membrane assembly [Mactra antiquata]